MSAGPAVASSPKTAGFSHHCLMVAAYDEEGADPGRRGRTEDGATALAEAKVGDFDVVLLDVMLPGMDGFDVCRGLRAEKVWAPVLMLTARNAVADRIHGLDAGADDYLAKPFSFEELLARVRALARRGRVERPAVLSGGDLTMDPATRQVWRDEQEAGTHP